MADSAAVNSIPIYVLPYTIYIFVTTNQKSLIGAVTPVLYFNGLFNQSLVERWFNFSCKYLIQCIDILIFKVYLNVKPTSFFI